MVVIVPCHPLLELAVLVTKMGHIRTVGLMYRITGETLLTRLQEVFAPAVIQVGGDAFPAAQLRDAYLTKALKDNSDLLFGGKLTACLSVDVANYGFGVTAVSGVHKHVLS